MTAQIRHKKIVFILIGVVIGFILGAAAGYFAGTERRDSQSIDSYEECVAAGYPIMESYPAQCAVPGGESFTQDILTTLEGKVVCLPHKNTDGPQTLECATGLLADDGKYYALQSEDPDNSLASRAGSDKRVRVTGVLRQEDDDKYRSEGTIQVKSYALL